MAGFHIISLSLAVAAFTLAGAAQKPELATEVCKNTTDFNFCRSTVYSDPGAATADRYTLMDIVSRKAYLTATQTRDYVASNAKKSGATESESISLKKCVGDYDKAIQKMEEMLGNLNDDSYYELDVMSREVEGLVYDCRNGLDKRSTVWGSNESLLKVANICYVVAKLF